MPVTCYLCGRHFGKWSFGFHFSNCHKNWEEEQKKKPKKQRRPLPAAPENLNRVLTGEVNDEELSEFNEASAAVWNEEVLEECNNCGRYDKDINIMLLY